MSNSSAAAAPLGVEEARRRLPELLERAAGGEEFVIQRHKKPMAALVPLGGQAPTDPLKRQRQIQSLMALQGSGRRSWDSNQHHPASPGATAPEFVQEIQQDNPGQDDHNTSPGQFRPSQLVEGSRIALDGSALVACRGFEEGLRSASARVSRVEHAHRTCRASARHPQNSSAVSGNRTVLRTASAKGG
jgi:antitoxin (DNA-binding transcriptional repressor) of toxin-antitoxin stability system